MSNIVYTQEKNKVVKEKKRKRKITNLFIESFQVGTYKNGIYTRFCCSSLSSATYFFASSIFLVNKVYRRIDKYYSLKLNQWKNKQDIQG
jgi:hypothetical protein